jgi:hypothetical protein
VPTSFQDIPEEAGALGVKFLEGVKALVFGGGDEKMSRQDMKDEVSGLQV